MVIFIKAILFKKDKARLKYTYIPNTVQKSKWFYKQRKNFFLNVQIISQLRYSCNQN